MSEGDGDSVETQKEDSIFKTLNPRMVYTMIGCHEVARIKGKAADSHGNPITRNFRQRTPQQDIIRINHYAVSYPVIPVPFGRNKPRGLGKQKELSLKTSNFKAGVDRNVKAFNAVCEHYPDIKHIVENQ